MLKKIILIFMIINIFAAAPPVVFAVTPFTSEQIGQQKVDKLYPDKFINDRANTRLPTRDVKKEIIPRAIKILLTLAATVAFCVFVYSGVMLVIAQGNEEDIKKFKQALVWSLVGLTFIAGSYAIVSGILKISFT